MKDHVVEFEECQRLLALQAKFDRIEGQHAIDGEVRSDVAQKFNIAEFAQPFVIVDHDRIGWPVPKVQQSLKHGEDSSDVIRYNLVGHHAATFVSTTWIADLSSSATHHDDRLMTSLLKAAQHHYLDQATDM